MVGIMGVVMIGCSGPSHLPAPWELPGAVLGNAIDNATYGARRGRVVAYLTENASVLRSELAVGAGIHNDRVMDLAGIPLDRRQVVNAEFRASPNIYLGKSPAEILDIEAVTVLLMVNGNR